MSPVKQRLHSSESGLLNHPVLPRCKVIFVLWVALKRKEQKKKLAKLKDNLKVFLGSFRQNPALTARWQGWSSTVAFQQSIRVLAQLG